MLAAIIPDTPYAIAMIAITVLAAVLSLYVWRLRSSPGGLYFSLLMAAVAEWAFFMSLEMLMVDLPLKVFCSKLAYLGLVSICPLLLLFALDYSGHKKWLTRNRIVLFFVIPAITFLLAMTNEWHDLIWSMVELGPNAWGSSAIYEHGPYFWVHAAYSYLLGAVGILLLVVTALRSPPRRRRQTLVLLAGIVVAVAGSAVLTMNTESLSGFDVAAIAFAITGIVYGLNVVGNRMFDERPIASMADGVVVLDGENYITDMNPSAQEMLGTKGHMAGRPVEEVLVPYPDLLSHLKGDAAKPAEILMKLGNDDRWLDARISPLLDRQKEQAGRLIVLRDVTESKRAEEELKTAKQQAEIYLDLMGHDLNNMHQIALGYLELALSLPPEARRDELLEKPVEVLQRSAQLIKNVRKLQKLKDGVFNDRDIDVCEVLAEVKREYGAIPNRTITLNLNGNDHCRVVANDLLHDVFANLVSNAIKHTVDRTSIDIGLDVIQSNGSRYCQVSVEDRGPGIPDNFKARIFNRVLKSSDKAKGIGLGLYLVKSLVDSYGGRVWVEDRVPGDHAQGARFVVQLPAAQ